MIERWFWAALAVTLVVVLAGYWRQRRHSERKTADERDSVVAAEQLAARSAATELAEREVMRIEAQRVAEQEAAQIETQRLAEQEAERIAAQRRAEQEAERIAAQRLAEQEAARIEAQRLAELEAARIEVQRQAELEAARIEAQRQAELEAARIEAQRQAELEAARIEAQRQAEQEAARIEAQHLAELQAARIEAQRQAEQEVARIEAHHLAELQAARIEAQRVAEQEAARLLAERSAVAAPRKPPEQTVVMVADDSKVVRVKTSRLLAKHQYQVVLAEDGLDAVRLMSDAVPDVLITDVEMPGLDGFQLARQVRGDPRTAHIPIIMITSADDRHSATATEAGVSVLLGKPYPEEALIAYIESTLDRRATPRPALLGVQ